MSKEGTAAADKARQEEFLRKIAEIIRRSGQKSAK
jgi:hypothetical protein